MAGVRGQPVSNSQPLHHPPPIRLLGARPGVWAVARSAPVTFLFGPPGSVLLEDEVEVLANRVRGHGVGRAARSKMGYGGLHFPRKPHRSTKF